jgi:glutathione S-transferase
MTSIFFEMAVFGVGEKIKVLINMSAFHIFKELPGISLPSFNPYCIFVELYIRGAGIQCVLHESVYPYSALAQGPLPALRWHREVISGAAILPYIKQHGFDFDKHFSLSTQSDIEAYSHWLRKEFRMLHLWLQWAHEPAYQNVTKKYFAKGVPFPTNIVTRLQAHRDALAELNSDPQFDTRRYLAADYQEKFRCFLGKLDNRLGTQPYLFGDLPSSVDFFAAAHLAWLFHFANDAEPAATAPHKSESKCDNIAEAKQIPAANELTNPLRRVLESFPALVTYFQCILELYLKPASAMDVKCSNIRFITYSAPVSAEVKQSPMWLRHIAAAQTPRSLMPARPLPTVNEEQETLKRLEEVTHSVMIDESEGRHINSSDLFHIIFIRFLFLPAVRSY